MSELNKQRWFPNSMPNPMVDHHTWPWWQAAQQKKLTVQRCTQCHHCQHPAKPICSECLANDFDWPELSGKGTLYTYTVVHQPVSMEQELPFIIAIIDLDMSDVESANGVRIMSNLVDFNLEEVSIGKPVELVWEQMSEEVVMPRFVLTA